MTFSFDDAHLAHLRRHHPAWRLLQADYAPLMLSFFHKVFVEPNARGLPQSYLIEKLQDQLFKIREREGEHLYLRTPLEYLDEWADDDRGWLRKYYPELGETGHEHAHEHDEAHYDLTPATEIALGWMHDLLQQAFVGTEARLLTSHDLLRQIVWGSGQAQSEQLQALKQQRAVLDAQIARLEQGESTVLDETAQRERFMQLSRLAREVLQDFRQVEANFRDLDRRIRTRIASWEGSKGALLDSFFGEHDAIAHSEQGRSFRAFWKFLMSSERQEEISKLLQAAFELPAIQALNPDPRLKRIHHEWLLAGEHTQRVVAQLSQQLRHFLDDRAWHEHRRVLDLIHQVEALALAQREQTPTAADFMSLEHPTLQIELPMERPLFSPPLEAVLPQTLALADADDLDTIDSSVLYQQTVIDREALRASLAAQLAQRGQPLSLAELLARRPLEHGLAELVTWLALASESAESSFDDEQPQAIPWRDELGQTRVAHLASIVWHAERATLTGASAASNDRAVPS